MTCLGSVMAREKSAGAIEAFMREAISSQDRLNDGLVKLRIIGCEAVERMRRPSLSTDASETACAGSQIAAPAQVMDKEGASFFNSQTGGPRHGVLCTSYRPALRQLPVLDGSYRGRAREGRPAGHRHGAGDRDRTGIEPAALRSGARHGRDRRRSHGGVSG